MSTNESPTKRKTDIQGSDSANKRRSLRDRSTIISPTADAGKLSPMELIGSLTFDIAKSEEGWTVKDHRNGITKTFTSKDGKTFDSFEAIGEFSIVSKDWMEELVDDEGAIDALQQLARDGDERATCALETLGIALEEDEEDDDEKDDDDDDESCQASPAAKRISSKVGTQIKVQKKGSQNKSEKNANATKKKEGKSANATNPSHTFKLSDLDVTGMFDSKRNYSDISGSNTGNNTAASKGKFSMKLKDWNVSGMLFDPKRNYSVASEVVVDRTNV